MCSGLRKRPLQVGREFKMKEGTKGPKRKEVRGAQMKEGREAGACSSSESNISR